MPSAYVITALCLLPTSLAGECGVGGEGGVEGGVEHGQAVEGGEAEGQGGHRLLRAEAQAVRAARLGGGEETGVGERRGCHWVVEEGVRCKAGDGKHMMGTGREGRAYRGQDAEWREGRGGEEGRGVGVACACGQMLREGREQGPVALFACGLA